jgi:hypothetical protein
MGVLTWGQIRLSLQQTVPGISLDLIDEFLTTRYARVLDHTRWLGAEGTAYVQTATPYRSTTDTVFVTQGSNVVTGSGTAWTSALTGQKFQVVSDGPFYTFTYVSATSATLDRVFEGLTNSGLGYLLFTNVYPAPPDFKELLPDGLTSADDGFPLDILSEAQLNDSAGFRDVIGEPGAVAVTISPTSLDGGTTWQFEFFPIPSQAKGYPVRYQRTAAAFDGTNTGATSLPFVSDGVILAGCRSDIWAHMGNPAKTQFYELKFQDELMTMVKADRRKRAPEVVMPAKRLTRHRIARLVRNGSSRILP